MVSTKCRLQTRHKKKKKTYWGRHNIKLHAKTFHRVYTAVIDRDRITSWLIYDNKIFCTTLFWCSLKRPSVKLTKLVVWCLNVPWKSFYVSVRTTCVLWHSESSATVTLLLDADWMMVKNVSNQRGRNSMTVAHEIPAANARRLESCISGKLFGG